MNGVEALDHIRIVLSRTSHPGNIGAAARAMKTMGLSRLVLVDPAVFPDPVAEARASGAADILANATVVDSLDQALQGCVLVAALTARKRELAAPAQWARAAALELGHAAREHEIALVFGNETSGLSNEDLRLCHMPVMVPANPQYSSLNLGAAVQLMCYELRMACVEPGDAPYLEGAPATFEEVEGLYRHLERAMTASGFYDPANPKRLWPRVRRLFGRIRLEREEVGILRGLLSALEKKT